MPEAAEDHGKHQVGEVACHTLAIATQREVQVIAQPARQGDVPALPEFAQAVTDIGVAEIARQRNPEHPRQADGHLAVAGEIEIDLQGEHRGGEPGGIAIEPPRVGKQLISQGRQVVGEQNFLDQPCQEDQAAQLHVPGSQRRQIFQLFHQFRGTQDGTGDHVREKCDVQAPGTKRDGMGPLAAIHVYHHRQHVEGVEADAQRQGPGGPAGVEPCQGRPQPCTHP